MATDNFPLWWAYSVNAAANLPPFMVNGNTAETIVQQIHDGMVPKQSTDTNGLLAYMRTVYSKSSCAADVTGCNLYTDVYGPLEAYFQEIVASQITLAQAVAESYAELASFYQTDPGHAANAHVWDGAVDAYMTDFQQKLSEEAESFVEVAEQIALYRAADGRFDWSTFDSSDAAQLLARADFLAARLVGSASGKPWAWPPGVTGRIFYTEQAIMPAATAHQACLGGSCTTLTEMSPMPHDLACKTNTAYPGVCFLSGDWPYLQWSSPDGNNVVTGTPTYVWKMRRITQQPMAEGAYQAASMNSRYGNADLMVLPYGDEYSNPPAQGTTTVLFGSFNAVEGTLGVGELGTNQTHSGGGDDKVHDFTVSGLANSTQMKVTYKTATGTGAAINGDWYEKRKIKVNAVPGSFPRVRVFWPNTVSIRSTRTSGSDRPPSCAEPRPDAEGRRTYSRESWRDSTAACDRRFARERKAAPPKALGGRTTGAGTMAN